MEEILEEVLQQFLCIFSVYYRFKMTYRFGR